MTSSSSPSATVAEPVAPGRRLRRRLGTLALVGLAGVVPMTMLSATPAHARSAKCGVVSYDPATHTSVVVCSRNRP